MSKSSDDKSNGGQAPPVPAGTQRAIPDVIDFVYDADADGAVAANAEIRTNDWSNIIGEHETKTNEVIEVERVEMDVPQADAEADDAHDDPLESFEALRLWNGSEYYPHLRFREFMLDFYSSDSQMRTPRLGVPVLSGEKNPEADPINTATPKFGPSTAIAPALQNDDEEITDSFRVRFYVWRWEGTNSEFSGYLNAIHGRSTFSQSIRMSNPYTGNTRTYNRGRSVRLSGNSALNNFDQLTGGIDQTMPRVWPWATWTTNNKATRQNQFYQFTTRNDRVTEKYHQLEFDFTSEREAAIFEQVQVTPHADLKELEVHNAERSHNPTIMLGDGIEHELPLLRPLDGSRRLVHDTDSLPRTFSDRLGGKQVVWDDGGGIRIRDDGDASIPADELLIGVQGHRLELTS